MAPVLIVALTAASYLVAILIATPALVPLLNTAPAFPFMVASLRRGLVAEAIARMLVWAAAMGVSATMLSYAGPGRTGRLFINGDAYRREMVTWILTGAGTEGDPSRFIPQHALHATAFAGLALATGGVAAMPMGAVLMNYMGHYVGALAALGRRPAATAILAWHPWAIVRVVSFVILGVLLSGPLLARVMRFRFSLLEHRAWLIAAAAGLALDVLLKWTLAGTWRILLARSLGWSSL